MEEKHKSQLAKDLAHALFICQLRDDLYELVEDASVQDRRTEKHVRDMIHTSYRKATVLLACAMNREGIQEASGQ